MFISVIGGGGVKIAELGSLIENLIGLTSVNDELRLPQKTVLHQNYTSPFNPATIISFALPKQKRLT
jgi:hypothetical protein